MLVLYTVHLVLISGARGLMLCMFQLLLIGNCIFHILRVEKIQQKMDLACFVRVNLIYTLHFIFVTFLFNFI